ncbi:helix-turn-helix transcriptional regulator [Methylobacterium planeticum]|uniref:Helix-turn-helix transcriptional regulator n=1 Tax=Methylobacterium planeticum TaxID=2615211 RepID=A0A6N6MRK7_9HYPH|nr:helix-turn-helix transcriptional regulator [Methylobacterium planeticum]
MSKLPAITAAQCRAARAFLGWSQKRLVKASGVGLSAIVAFEHGGSRCVSRETVAELRGVLEEAGLDFISLSGGVGVLFREA